MSREERIKRIQEYRERELAELRQFSDQIERELDGIANDNWLEKHLVQEVACPIGADLLAAIAGNDLHDEELVCFACDWEGQQRDLLTRRCCPKCGARVTTEAREQ